MFLFLYLRNLRLSKIASLFGVIAFIFSGFFVAWLEWGTILNVALWLPLILLATDKMFGILNLKSEVLSLKSLGWSIIFVLSMASSFFAGHLQMFFYLILFVYAYFLARWIQYGKKIKTFAIFIILNSIFIILIVPQLIPTIRFIALSARTLDLPNWQVNPGWFIPWQNLIQFLAPDFFGNPATLNYFGIWNYGEFIGYVGILPMLMAFLALFFRRDKKTLFFGSAFFLSLIFALPTFLAKLPFQLNLPFISTAQPTRLLFITDFSLSVMAALGLDYFLALKNRKYILPVLIFLGLCFLGLWSFILRFHGQILSQENLNVVRQNLIFPTLIFIIISTILLILIFLKHKKTSTLLIMLLVIVSIVDLFRFAWKFEPFTNKADFFPSTTVTSFLQNQEQPFRIMSTDSRILPPNFSIMYKLQTLDGYDPLYLQRYGELMVAAQRGKPDITPPFGFNRIITPHDIKSNILNLLGFKYVLSFDNLNDMQFKQVFTDGVVKVYKNNAAFPRAFFVTQTLLVGSKQNAIYALFSSSKSLSLTAIVENGKSHDLSKEWSLGEAKILDYQPNTIDIGVNNKGEGFLVLTDSYYPTWHAKIDGKETQIYLTDYNFRGIIIPKGKHTIEFYDTLF